MLKPSSTGASVAALLVALGAVVGASVSRAAADECLSAPNGPAPKGQHWYYHLDRATQRKCWYVRAVTAPAQVAPASSAQDESDSAPLPAAAPAADAMPVTGATAAATPHAAAREPAPSDPSPPESAASAGQPQPPPDGLVDATDAAPAPAPVEPHISPAPTVDPDPVQNAAMPSHAPANLPDAPEASADPITTGAVTPPAAMAAEHGTPATTNAPPASPAHEPSDTATIVAAAEESAEATSTIAENVLVVALAAALAGLVFAIFAAVGRRRRLDLRDVGNGSADAGFRFGSGPERDGGAWPARAGRRAGQRRDAPIQSSLIPEQVPMSRTSGARRVRRPVMRARPHHIE
jgi:hypothetical protein